MTPAVLLTHTHSTAQYVAHRTGKRGGEREREREREGERERNSSKFF